MTRRRPVILLRRTSCRIDSSPQLSADVSTYTARVRWERGEHSFIDKRYSRAHTWEFDGGLSVPASASPDIVPLPHSVAENVDPEEAFIASISSCHMLFFLDYASRKGFVVDRYDDNATGVLGKNADGRIAMTKVTLRPCVRFSGDRLPTRAEIEELHERSHHACFIANSVTTEVATEIVD